MKTYEYFNDKENARLASMEPKMTDVELHQSIQQNALQYEEETGRKYDIDDSELT